MVFLGNVSKVILETVKLVKSKKLGKVLVVNQCKHMGSVINWFNTIKNKSQCFFIQLDVVGFYPSILENVLDTALNFAKEHTDIFDENLRII